MGGSSPWNRAGGGGGRGGAGPRPPPARAPPPPRGAAASTPPPRPSDARARADGAVERWPLHTLTFADVADRLMLGFRDARRALPRTWPDTDPEDLHELRKRIVAHRYQMEIVAPLWPRFGRVWVAEAQRLRDRLGRHQDLTPLARPMEPHPPLAPWRASLTPAIARRSEVTRPAQ